MSADRSSDSLLNLTTQIVSAHLSKNATGLNDVSELIQRVYATLQGLSGTPSTSVATKPPAGVPQANWLPVPDGPFNIMLRVYGVEEGSSVANDTYVPPGIELVRGRSVRVPSPSRGRLPVARR